MIATPDNFIAIPLMTLRENQGRLPDLYLRYPDQEKPILYRSASYQMQELDWEELEDLGWSYLWLHESEAAKFSQRFEERIDSIIHDSQIELSEKCEMVFSVAYQWMQQVFESSNPRYVLQSSEPLISGFLEVIFSDPRAAHLFITKASVNFELYSHSINVLLYGVSLAKNALEISQEEALTQYGPGFLMHDIGKLRIPETLWDIEDSDEDSDDQKTIRHHIDYGIEIIREFIELPPASEAIIRHHHERMDGSGYPDGLVGEQIPIEARIAAIADLFDTLSTNRSQRERMTSFEALKLMRSMVPGKFDENLFERFVFLFHPPVHPSTGYADNSAEANLE